MADATRAPSRSQKHGSGWFVPSGQVGYYVEQLQGRWRCTCPSFRWRKRGTCKHIAAVKREMAMQD